METTESAATTASGGACERAMDQRSRSRTSAPWDRLELVKVHATLAVLAVLAVAPVVIIVSLVPGPLILPALSLAAFAGAALTAAAAWMAGAKPSADRMSLWDVSGALMLMACAAGMHSRPENVLQLVGYAAIP
jgi:hypothetical protein